MTVFQNKILFSVIIPAYNAEKTLSRTLESLKAQEGIESAEIIVVNDGSIDKTADIARGFEVKVLQKPNGGPASARNLGVEHSAGEIILFTDCDCVPQPGWFKAMTEPFEDGSVFGVKGIYINNNRSIIARIIQLEFEERYLMLQKQPTIDFVDSYSAAFRKDAFLQVGGFDENFPRADNEDVDLSYKLASKGFKMVFAPKAEVEHLGHPATLLKYVKVKFSRGFWRTAVYKRHPQKAVKDSYTPQTLKAQILNIGFLWIGFFLGLLLNYWILFWVAVGGFFLLTGQFVLKVYKYDSPAAILSPLLHLVRANCFMLGIGTGIVRHFFK